MTDNNGWHLDAPQPPDPHRSSSLLKRMVDALAPRIFALVEDYGEEWNERVFAWGMAFDHHVEVTGANGSWRGGFDSVDRAVRLLSMGADLTLVWADPPRDTPGE